jgi:hypothetical protein
MPCKRYCLYALFAVTTCVQATAGTLPKAKRKAKRVRTIFVEGKTGQNDFRKSF